MPSPQVQHRPFHLDFSHFWLLQSKVKLIEEKEYQSRRPKLLLDKATFLKKHFRDGHNNKWGRNFKSSFTLHLQENWRNLSAF